MSSNGSKLDNGVRENPVNTEVIGLREKAQELINEQRRGDLVREHRIELSHGSNGPKLAIEIHGISAVEFLQKVEQIIPDIGERSAVVGLALQLGEKHPLLGEKIERGKIEAAIGRSESEWAKICDNELRAGIAGRSIPLRDLMILSGARHLLEPDKALEPSHQGTFSRAYGWIAKLRREQD